MNQRMTERGLRSATELAADKPHGTRIRYMGGCKCDECRAANTNYEKERAIARKNGEANGLVSTELVRKHMLKLSKKGIGYKSVGDITDLSKTVLFAIYSGNKKQCRAMTAKKILGVTPDMAADGAYICAKKSWKKINDLLAQGYSKVSIAEGIGQTRALQLGKAKITARHAATIDALYEKLNGKLPKKNLTVIEVSTPTGMLKRNTKSGHVVHRLI
jgi:hypothetical protein